MSQQTQYVINDRGERVGVILDIEAYQKLASSLTSDPEYLSSLSVDELQALAEIQIAIASQSRLDDLLARNKESQLSADEVAELDYAIAQVDRLTILKTRARYTLKRLQELPVAS
jgi:hypothetical protein